MPKWLKVGNKLQIYCIESVVRFQNFSFPTELSLYHKTYNTAPVLCINRLRLSISLSYSNDRWHQHVFSNHQIALEDLE